MTEEIFVITYHSGLRNLPKFIIKSQSSNYQDLEQKIKVILGACFKVYVHDPKNEQLKQKRFMLVKEELETIQYVTYEKLIGMYNDFLNIEAESQIYKKILSEFQNQQLKLVSQLL